MTASELQDWLLSDGIKDELDLITRCTVLSEISNVRSHPDSKKLDEDDWERLLLAGSVLARSKQRSHVEAALRIATAAIGLEVSELIKDSAGVLLQKLTNYRAVELAERKGLLRSNLVSRLGIAARVEAVSRSLNTSVLVEHSGIWLQVNQFQQDFWTEANRVKTWISASAPTASGKTFLVSQWLLDQIQTQPIRVAVYLAPTRALVSEIEQSLSSIIKAEKLSSVETSSLPLAEKYLDAVAGKSKVIFVLTQERLHLLANVLDDDLKVDLLIADEAHKIGDKLRGVVLQDAMERVTRANPSIKLVFVSPATQNPEALLEDAPDGIDRRPVDSDVPTVLQNIILATQVPRRTTEWSLTLRQNDGTALPLGVLDLASRPTTLKKKLAFIAASAGSAGGTLVYVNGAAEAEEVASLISQLVEIEGEKIDKDLLALSDLAKRGVHESYLLAPLVKRGVAFHYGNMPSLLREEIERLFRSGKIRFLVCTSTLIEGVNLSCRTIIVRGPRKGAGHPMEPHDFWNLAGRAGRWGNEFQGNVICVDPEDTKAWPQGVPSRRRYPIERETDLVLKSGDVLTEFISSRSSRSTAELSQDPQLEQVCAYLMATYLRDGTIAKAPFAKRHSTALIGDLDASLQKLSEGIGIPADIAARHPGVNPYALNRLLVAFQEYEGDVEDFLPAPPESKDAYDRFSKIMGLINLFLYPAFQPETLIPLHSLVVLEWLKGYSLASIIGARIKYNKRSGRQIQLAKLIRETMEFVEQVARFRAPKYFSAYIDVLKLHLTAVGRQDLLATDLDIGVALEFGVSTRTLLSLMELGISRMSAVAIYEKIARDNLTREEVSNWIREHAKAFDGMDIPLIILREIRQKILDGDESEEPSNGEA